MQLGGLKFSAVEANLGRIDPKTLRRYLLVGNLQGTGYLKAVWPDFFGSVFGVWAAPGGFETLQKCGGRSPPHFWMVLKPRGAAQTPKTDPQNSGQTAFGYPVISLPRQVHVSTQATKNTTLCHFIAFDFVVGFFLGLTGCVSHVLFTVLSNFGTLTPAIRPLACPLL